MAGPTPRVNFTYMEQYLNTGKTVLLLVKVRLHLTLQLASAAESLVCWTSREIRCIPSQYKRAWLPGILSYGHLTLSS